MADDKPLSDALAQVILEEARERLKLAIDAEEDNRKMALDDLKFLNGEQWEKTAKQARAGRPMLTINRLPTFVRQVVNEQRKSRPAIDVIPADSAAAKPTADVMQGMIRHIEQTSRAQIAYDWAFEMAVSCGIGHFRIKTEYYDDASFDQDLCVQRIENPFSVYRDPDSTEPDHSDDRFTFITDFVDPDDFEEKYGFRPTTMSEAGSGDRAQHWFEGDKVRVAEYWRVYEEDQMLYATSVGHVLTDLTPKEIKQLKGMGVDILNQRKGAKRTVENYVLTYDKVIKKQEYKGKYIPICTVVGGELNIEGKRVLTSLVRWAKDPSRLYNYWASAETEAMALQPKAPMLVEERHVDGLEGEWSRANTENQAYLRYKAVDGVPPPNRNPPPIFPDGLRQGREAAAEDIKAVIGIWDASLGARSNEVSGIAIRAREEQGDDSVYHFIGNQARAIEYAGRVMIDLIPKIYDTPRVVRTINATDQSQTAVINQTFIDPQTGQENLYQMDAGRYDVAVRVGPSFESKRQEMVASIIELSDKFPPLMQIAGSDVIRNMDWPMSEQIADKLDQAQQAQSQQKPPEQALAEAQIQTEQIKGENLKLRGQMDQQKQAGDNQVAAMKQQADAQKIVAQAREAQLQAQVALAEVEVKREQLNVEKMALQIEVLKLQNERLAILNPAPAALAKTVQ